MISTNSTVVLSLLDGCWWYKCYEGRKNLCVLSKDQAVQQRQCINVSLGQKDQNWTSKLSTITSRMLLKQLKTFSHFHHLLSVSRSQTPVLTRSRSVKWPEQTTFQKLLLCEGWAPWITSFTIRNPWKSDCLSASPFNLSWAGAWNFEESTFTFIFFAAALSLERNENNVDSFLSKSLPVWKVFVTGNEC